MAMMHRFSAEIPPAQRERAEELLRSGAVSVQESLPAGLKAVVTIDGRPHTAVLACTPLNLHYFCTCGVAGHGELCDHIAAAALAADSTSSQRHNVGETRPRRPDRGPVWLSARGDLKRLDVEEPRPAIVHRPSPPSWKKQLAKLRETGQSSRVENAIAWPADRQVLYVIDVPASIEANSLVVKLAIRDRKQSGQWSRPKTRGVSFPSAADLPDPRDREILTLLKGASGRYDPLQSSYDPSYFIPDSLRSYLVEVICRTGRAFLNADDEEEDLHPLAWDEHGPWELWLEGRLEQSTQQYLLSGTLRRGEEKMPVGRPLLIVAGGVVFTPELAAPLEAAGTFPWIALLRLQRAMAVPAAQAYEWLGELFAMAHLPHLDLPEELRVQEVRAKPVPKLHVQSPQRHDRPGRLRVVVWFDYDGATAPAAQGDARTFFQSDRQRLILRDVPAERDALRQLRELGAREIFNYKDGHMDLWLAQRHLPRVVRALVEKGWQVEADGNLYRRAATVQLRVASGIDWFELHGDIDFEGQSIKLPQLLAAIKRGQTTVSLDDGTLGIIPEAWLKRFGLLAGLGQRDGDSIKFAKNQIGLLDALLDSQEATWDDVFELARREIHEFQGVHAVDAPPGFVGELRPYQREGLGWFEFLRRFSFGGCLADDMGLGKTVQVLALLEARRQIRQTAGAGIAKPPPSLVVVPKSLVFNWLAEAKRFTPALRIVDHTGIERAQAGQPLMDYDVVLTTYGTLRRDVTFLKDVWFDYIVLDEAQAVKNPASESAKAVRLVQGNHRLALSGTPVQNHLGDLWSLFDFLNPGMLGLASVFANSQSAMRNPDPQTRVVLAKALRPFILRRTKEQVATELPPRLEQTIYCELDEAQRKLYDDLRRHYRVTLLSQIDRDGIGKSKIQILEALLRLRQAALHPGLLDPARKNQSSAKLDMLLPQLEEVIDEGHKALVFSQFTSMLAIVRDELDRRQIPYEYLDGKTTDREARVTRFQSDETCKLFLISLKAGGLGLNLTAADYVFLLDPWWNPAVEQQAIDRTHRIGQTRQVYACRLIAKDTVEEKVLSLQQSKKDLADAIITADNSLIRTMGRAELEMLLS